MISEENRNNGGERSNKEIKEYGFPKLKEDDSSE